MPGVICLTGPHEIIPPVFPLDCQKQSLAPAFRAIEGSCDVAHKLKFRNVCAPWRMYLNMLTLQR
jgi:hypothetical protein